MLNSTGQSLGRKISSVGENITNGTERNFGNDCGVSANTLSGTLESIVDFLKMLNSTGLALGRKISFVDVNISNGTERNFGYDCGVSENVYNIDLGTLPPCQLFGEKDSITLKGTLESIVDFL